MIAGEWTDPQRAKVKLADYARSWIAQRPGLRPRTVDLYTWLLDKHIAPHLGAVPIGKLSTPMIREWRATLLREGVSVSYVSAKAYRFLRAVMMTAVEDDKILSRNPCRVRGAGDEHAGERPVLTVGKVFELADKVGRHGSATSAASRPGGSGSGFAVMAACAPRPRSIGARLDAERALWQMAGEGQADCEHDRRYCALVLLATFASLRWGEATALQRCDLDLDAGTVRVRQAFSERRSPGGMIARTAEVQGWPTRCRHPGRDHSDTSRPPGGVRDVRAHTRWSSPGRGWPDAPRQLQPAGRLAARSAAIGAPGLHFHDLRHIGNHVRGVHRRRAARSDGPDGARQ